MTVEAGTTDYGTMHPKKTGLCCSMVRCAFHYMPNMLPQRLSRSNQPRELSWVNVGYAKIDPRGTILAYRK